MTKTILRYEFDKKQIMQLDEQDVEIIRVLHHTSGWANADEIKRMGDNMPEEYLVEKKLYFLKDQDIVEINDLKKARLTFKGNNLFWNTKEVVDKKILRLIQFGTYTEKEIRHIIGLQSKEIEEGTRHLILLELLDMEGTGKEENDEKILFSLSHKGKIRLKAEEPTPTVQNENHDDVRETIIDTEEKLRDMVHSVMMREHGPSWEDDSTIGWSKSKKEELQHRMAKRKEEFPTKQLSDRLIDYGYVLDLKNIITKNEKIFKPIFLDWKESMFFFDTLGKYRNPPMHSTTALQNHEKSLCVGICGKFNEITDHWKKGYLRKTKSYSCDYMFDVLEGNDPDAANKKALADANSWLDKIKQNSLGVIGTEDIPGRGEALVIKFKEGIVKITIPKTTRQNYNDGYCQSGRIHVVTEKFDVLDRVIELGDKKYWCLNWMTSDLDVAKVVSRVYEIEGKTPPANQTDLEKYIIHDMPLRVRVDLKQDLSNMTRIDLVHEGGMGEGFRSAHEIFSPDSILSMLYREISPIEIRKLVERAENPV